MTDRKNIVEFDTAKEPLLHRRREDKVKRMRNAFKAAREAVSDNKKANNPQHRSHKRNKKKKR